MIFTLPDELGPLVLQNKVVIYNLLFRATSETLLEAAARWKDLKAKIGFFAILHSWGQKLDLHPHLHCVVPGGGISLDGKRWVSCPRGFFMPVKLLSRMFRGKFLAYLKQAHRRGELTCKGRLQDLVSYHAFNAWLSPLYKKDWVVYAKPPWNGPENALKYLARYTHRVAIANSRLQSIDDGQVTFTYKDYRHHRQRTLTLSATEFIRRFMMHVLPNCREKQQTPYLCAQTEQIGLIRVAVWFCRQTLCLTSPLMEYIHAFTIPFGSCFLEMRACRR